MLAPHVSAGDGKRRADETQVEPTSNWFASEGKMKRAVPCVFGGWLTVRREKRVS